MRAAPLWGDLEAIADTLPYDAACLGNGAADRPARHDPPTGPRPHRRRPSCRGTGVGPRPRQCRRRDRQRDPRRRARHSRQAVPRTRPRRRRQPIGELLPGLTDLCDPAGNLTSRREYGLDLSQAIRRLPGSRRDRAPQAFGRAGTTVRAPSDRSEGRQIARPERSRGSTAEPRVVVRPPANRERDVRGVLQHWAFPLTLTLEGRSA